MYRTKKTPLSKAERSLYKSYVDTIRNLRYQQKRMICRLT